jgi:sugar lactone lactonase YvrE
VARSRRRREPTTSRRLAVRGGGALLGATLLVSAALAGDPALPAGFEVVATGIPRALQLVLDRRTLVVLAPGARGDSAGEIHRVDLDGPLPVAAQRQPRVRVPFVDARLATLGSVVLEPATRDLFVGEENGHRIYRLDADERMTLYVDGLRRLPGGGAMAFDAAGRLVVVDHADPMISPEQERTPPGLEQFRDEDYQGPLVFRLTLDPTLPLPRRIDRIPPLFPRAWRGGAGGAMLPRLVAVAAAGDRLLVLGSAGTLYRIGADARLTVFTTLPPGQYARVNMVPTPEGGLYVSGGFTVPTLFSVSPEGTVTTLAGPLGDPQGIALGTDGYLYLAESSLHRIVRLRVAGP